MKGSAFPLTVDDFYRMDKFLSLVTSTIGESYEFPVHSFGMISEEMILKSLGFTFLGMTWASNPIYQFNGTPTYSLAQIIVPISAEISDQWTILSQNGISVELKWNGPQGASNGQFKAV